MLSVSGQGTPARASRLTARRKAMQEEFHASANASASQPISRRDALCRRKPPWARWAEYPLALSRIPRWPTYGTSAAADSPVALRAAPAIRLKIIFHRGERNARFGIDQPTPGGVPPSPQPLTHPATDPGPLGRQGLLFAGQLVLGQLASALTAGPEFDWNALMRMQPGGGRTPASRFCDHRAYARPMTRSSRCTISARPPNPRMERISADERPLIFAASSAS